VEHVGLDYDSVLLRVRESSGLLRTVRCEGHIALCLDGFWDEVIVERAELASDHPAIRKSLSSISRRLGRNWPDSGNAQRNSRHWSALIVHLSDGCTIEIVAAKFTVD
jgi:hypothetical protein